MITFMHTSSFWNLNVKKSRSMLSFACFSLGLCLCLCHLFPASDGAANFIFDDAAYVWREDEGTVSKDACYV